MPESHKLAHAVQTALTKNETTAALDSVHVKAIGAAVFLDGEVETHELRELVEQIVRKVDGVGMVRNRLQINPQARGGGWREPHQHES